MKIKEQIGQNILQFLHYKMKDNIENQKIPSTEEIMQMDLTKDVDNFIDWAVKKGFYFSVVFNGAPSSGKSASMLKMQYQTNQALIKYKKFKGFDCKKINEKDFDLYPYITSDQVEFNEIIMKGITYCGVAIDELSDLAEGGDNTTITRQIFSQNALVNAQRYVYRFCATPRANSYYELTSLLVFRFLGRNDKEKVNYWLVYYNLPEDTHKYPIGVYRSYVGDILNRKWYLSYRKKKFARMDLLDKYSVRDKRELRTNEIILKVYDRLISHTKMGMKIPPELIKSKIEQSLQENRLIYTMLAKENTAEPLRGLLNLSSSINGLKMKRAKLNIAENPKDREKYNFLSNLIEDEEKTLNELLEHRKKMVKILKEYEGIK